MCHEYQNGNQMAQNGKIVQSFETGTINGAGTTKEVSNYSVIDETPLKGKNIYRIKQIDYDLKFSYSKVAAITLSNKQNLNVYPNPFNDVISIDAESSSESVLTISTMNGQVVYSQIVTGSSIISGLDYLDSGLYNVSVINNESQKTFKLIKQ
jgi:hypothetical protein